MCTMHVPICKCMYVARLIGIFPCKHEDYIDRNVRHLSETDLSDSSSA